LSAVARRAKAEAYPPSRARKQRWARHDADTKRKALEGGASGLLTKPIDFSLLREEIDIRVAAAN
jgi:hypothetical protein